MAVMSAEPDAAAVFAIAVSLRDACVSREAVDPELNVGEVFNGHDQLMREVMRVGELFEGWACRHVAFGELAVVWPYVLEEKFGGACLEVMEVGGIAGFDEDDCLRMACRLGFPLRAGGGLPLPVWVEAPNPLEGAGFVAIRISTVRWLLGGDAEVVPFLPGDDPFDECFGEPWFAVHGVRADGTAEHIAERTRYEDAVALVRGLFPGMGFPEEPVATARAEAERWR